MDCWVQHLYTITGLGTASSLSNAGQAAGNLAADSVRVTNALTAISKSGGRILFSHNSYVDELTEANFTSANRNTLANSIWWAKNNKTRRIKSSNYCRFDR